VLAYIITRIIEGGIGHIVLNTHFPTFQSEIEYICNLTGTTRATKTNQISRLNRNTRLHRAHLVCSELWATIFILSPEVLPD
jgi:predicted ATP-grasp superfamily ATP-dependent carboligase